MRHILAWVLLALAISCVLAGCLRLPPSTF